MILNTKKEKSIWLVLLCTYVIQKTQTYLKLKTLYNLLQGTQLRLTFQEIRYLLLPTFLQGLLLWK